MNSKLREKEIKEYFGDKSFSSDELYDFYAKKEPDLKKTTYRWRVYTLKNMGVINTIKKGVYATTRNKDFLPSIDKKLISLFMKATRQFPYAVMARLGHFVAA